MDYFIFQKRLIYIYTARREMFIASKTKKNESCLLGEISKSLKHKNLQWKK